MNVKNMLIILILLWVIGATFSHGPGVLVYLAIQLATTGLFMFMFKKVEIEYAKEESL
jgi:hypothetical protein